MIWERLEGEGGGVEYHARIGAVLVEVFPHDDVVTQPAENESAWTAWMSVAADDGTATECFWETEHPRTLSAQQAAAVAALRGWLALHLHLLIAMEAAPCR